MPLPNFFIIGAAKSGTTSLFNYLVAHPEVFLHPKKELRFFLDRRFGRGVGWYRDQFAQGAGFGAVGESSNGYTKYPLHPHVPERMARVVPDAKLLYIVREPMARLRSHWRHRKGNGDEWRDAERAVRENPIYTLTSLYGEQIERYYALFPAENIAVVEAEALFLAPEESLNAICDFLGVSRRGKEGYEADNITAERIVAPRSLAFLKRRLPTRRVGRDLIRHYRRSPLARRGQTFDALRFELSRELRAELEARFAEDLALLERLTGADFPHLRRARQNAAAGRSADGRPAEGIATDSERRGG